jgi:H/ACA ribonucleoprotein complex subunit 1
MLMTGFSGGGFRGGRGGGGGNFSTGPPDQVFGISLKINLTQEMGQFIHAAEGDMLYESTNTKIPYFNAPIYLENKVASCFAFSDRSRCWARLTRFWVL